LEETLDAIARVALSPVGGAPQRSAEHESARFWLGYGGLRAGTGPAKGSTPLIAGRHMKHLLQYARGGRYRLERATARRAVAPGMREGVGDA
jgi:hypothetical protein